LTKRAAAVPDDDKILDAAARLFRLKGFQGATLRALAKAAGLLPGSLHYRYPTKDALLLALMKRGVERDLTAVREAIAGSRDPSERLRLALRARLRYLLSRDASRVVLYDWRALKGRARAEMIRLRDEYESFVSGLLYEIAGRLRPDLDLKMLRLLLIGAVNSVAQWYSPDGQRTPDEIADALWGFFAFGVLDEAHRPRDIETALKDLSALEPMLLDK
jgi:TetR/AcrR family transcriptional regulator, cholesterol catabolism regulator